MASMAHISVLVLDLTFGEVYDEPQRAQPGLRPEPRICLTMKSMKDMKKAVAEFRTSCMTMLAEVTGQPIRLVHLPVWPKAKSLHVLHALHGELSVCNLHQPLNW